MSAPSPTGRVTLSDVADGGRRLARHDLEGPQRSAGRRRRGPASASRSCCARHGYQRRSGATTTKPELLELVFHELDRIWSMELIDGVESVAKENGLSVVLTVTGDRHSPGSEWLEGVLRRRPAGVILVFSDLAPELRERLRSRAIPSSIVDPAGDPSPRRTLGRLGQLVRRPRRDATPHRARPPAHRRDHGPRRHDVLARATRRVPLRDELRRACRSSPPGFASATSTSRAGAAEAMRTTRPARTARRRSSPAATCRRSARWRRRAIARAARARGLSIVGYDDIPLSRWVSPRLTTVHQPLRQMGVEAARLVLAVGTDAGGRDPAHGPRDEPRRAGLDGGSRHLSGVPPRRQGQLPLATLAP